MRKHRLEAWSQARRVNQDLFLVRSITRTLEACGPKKRKRTGCSSGKTVVEGIQYAGWKSIQSMPGTGRSTARKRFISAARGARRNSMRARTATRPALTASGGLRLVAGCRVGELR